MRKRLVGLITLFLLIVFTGCNSAVETISTQPDGSKETTANGKNSASNTETNRAAILLPASQNSLEGQKWGYINQKAEFVIKAEYDGVEEFNKAGIAVAYNYTDKELYKKKVYVVDKTGKKLLGPVKTAFYIITDNNIIIEENDKFRFINGKGEVFLETEKIISYYIEGLLQYGEKDGENFKSGLMDENGAVVIPAAYDSILPVDSGRIKVTVRNGDVAETYFIDRKGNKLKDKEQLLVFQDASTYNYGYKDSEGNVVLEPQYQYAEDFIDGRAAVELPDPKGGLRRKGLIDSKGNYVIKPEYTAINRLGEGLYAVNKGEFYYMGSNPYAIFDSSGRQLSDFIYYNPGSFSGGYASACDETATFLIGKDGKMVSDFKVKGIGRITEKDGILIANADGIRSYYTKDYKPIWIQDNSVLLSDGIKVGNISYRPDISTHVQYPQLENLPDKALQDSINKKLKSDFIDNIATLGISDGSEMDEDLKYEYSANFSARKNKSLLIIEESSYMFTGGAHGMPGRNYYHIDSASGKFYQLSDLFKKGSKYEERLRTIIHRQIDLLKSTGIEYADVYYDPESIAVKPDHPFVVTEEHLLIYYYPYEIAAYAYGFPEFIIPYGQIADIIDTEGALWKSFDKEIKDLVTNYIGDVDAEAREAISKLMAEYGINLVDAINTNEFGKVEANLLQGSSLYNDQKKLVENLFGRGIKERFESMEVYAIGRIYGEDVYKVFVKESVSVKHPDKEYVKQQYNWCYTAVEDNGTYKLTGIDKWPVK